MRKLALTAGMIGFLLSTTSVASAGGRPSRSPAGNTPFDFPAGMVCSFELAGQPIVDDEVTTTYPATANGDVLERTTGQLTYQLTNVDTGKSITVKISGPASYTTHSDGSATEADSGPTFVFFFPTDVPAGPTAYLNYGHTVTNFTADGQAILVSESGRQQDICAALS